MTNDIVILVGISITNSLFERHAGPHRLATELRKHGYNVIVVYGLNYYSFSELIEICERLVSEKTLCIGISTTFLLRDKSIGELKPFENTPAHLYNIEMILRHFKSKYKNLKSVAGGPTARSKMTGFETLFDAFFEGYSDTSFLKYVNNLKNNTIYLGQQYFRDQEAKNFDFKHSTIDYVDNDFIFPNESLILELTRGCIFKCKFCNYSNIGKNKNDDSWVKSASTLRQELISNYEKFGTTYYTFSDDTYNAGLDKVKYYHEVLTSLPFQVKFSTYIRIDLLHRWPEMISLLKESGLIGAFFGFESFNDYAKKTIGKGLDTLKILNTLEQCNKSWGNSVFKLGSFIYGLPGESVETMRDWTENIILKSGLFDDMSIGILPLLLTDAKNKTDKLYTSEFDREYDRYGYKMLNDTDNLLRWENNDTNYDECCNLATEMLNKIYSTKRPWGSFKVPPLLGYGLSMDEIRDISSSRQKVNQLTKTKYEQYKNYLLNI
jgi:hypothetical protein